MKNYLNYIDWNERLNTLHDNKVALYGAGKYGRIVLSNIRKYVPKLEVVCFIDDNKERNKDAVEGIEVLYLEEAIQNWGGDFDVLITNYYLGSVLCRLQMTDFPIERIFFWSELLIEDTPKGIVCDNREKLQIVYELLEDYQSKIIFKNIIESRWMKKTDVLSLLCRQKQYFPEDIFTFSESEVFVDGGGFNGDTVEQFINYTNGKYKHIYSFEPDRDNYQAFLNKHFDDRVTIYNAGLYRETTTLNFSGKKGGSSKIETVGEETVSVCKFDELDIGKSVVTFIKMDIEGSELDALEGMKETIKKYHPKLAICIYHKFEDLWKIPLFVRQLVPEYKLYIRNYTVFLDEIVLYATT